MLLSLIIYQFPFATGYKLFKSNTRQSPLVSFYLYVFPMFRWYSAYKTSSQILPEAVAQRCSVKKVFLEISRNSQENTCVRVSFSIKLQAEVCNFIKKRLWYRCFPVKFVKFPRTPFLKEHFRWLLLLCKILR